MELVRQYRARFPNVIQALEPNGSSSAAAAAAADGSLEGSRSGRDGQQKVTLDDLFPGLEPDVQDARLQEVGGEH